MDISRITIVILKNCQKMGKITHFTVKMELKKIISQFSMVQGCLNPNITFLGGGHQKARPCNRFENCKVVTPG